jgi:hypothetical protein
LRKYRAKQYSKEKEDMKQRKTRESTAFAQQSGFLLLSSLLAIVACIACLATTTFAWFTDSAVVITQPIITESFASTAQQVSENDAAAIAGETNGTGEAPVSEPAAAAPELAPDTEGEEMPGEMPDETDEDELPAAEPEAAAIHGEAGSVGEAQGAA